MPGHDVIVGFSAGGVDAMAQLAAGLPGDLPAAVLVVHHFPATSVSALPDILRRSGTLPTLHAVLPAEPATADSEMEAEEPAGLSTIATGSERM